MPEGKPDHRRSQRERQFRLVLDGIERPVREHREAHRVAGLVAPLLAHDRESDERPGNGGEESVRDGEIESQEMKRRKVVGNLHRLEPGEDEDAEERVEEQRSRNELAQADPWSGPLDD